MQTVPGTVELAPDARGSSLLPQSFVGAALAALDRVAAGLVCLGVTANAVTLASLVLASMAAVLLALDRLAWAAPLMTVASLGDALDGLVARRSAKASVGGALLDASVDRYEEAFLLGGVAVLVRGSLAALAVTLAALAGSFMVSYGSAKAEALHRPVPPGILRRAERAMLLCVGVAATPVFATVTRGRDLSQWASLAPLLVAVTAIAVLGNLSAIMRLRSLAGA